MRSRASSLLQTTDIKGRREIFSSSFSYKEKALPLRGADRNYKPGSVVLELQKQGPVLIYLFRSLPHGSSRPEISAEQAAINRSHWGVASGRVYICSALPREPVSSYLAFPSLPLARRFISVALSLKSPSADVIRYPCSMKPGLSSR